MDTILPNEQHILQWELNLAQFENQQFKDENQRLMGEFDAKDKIIRQIQEVQNKLQVKIQ